MPVCKTKRPHLRPLTIINSAQPENKTVKVFQRKMCSVKHSKTNLKKYFHVKKGKLKSCFRIKVSRKIRMKLLIYILHNITYNLKGENKNNRRLKTKLEIKE